MNFGFWKILLAWASQIGTSFSFELIQQLLGGEFNYDDHGTPRSDTSKSLLSSSQSKML